MIYYIIFSVDSEKNVSKIIPAYHRELLVQTESYYEDGRKHRKYCGWLTQKQFDKFISYTNLVAENTETIGSITEHGLFNAISFINYGENYSSNAYVTPFPQKYKFSKNLVKKKSIIEVRTAKQWQRIRNLIIDKYK